MTVGTQLSGTWVVKILGSRHDRLIIESLGSAEDGVGIDAWN